MLNFMGSLVASCKMAHSFSLCAWVFILLRGFFMRNLEKKRLMAGVMLAILAIDGYTTGDAYTYSGVTSTVNKVAEECKIVCVNRLLHESNSSLIIR